VPPSPGRRYATALPASLVKPHAPALPATLAAHAALASNVPFGAFPDGADSRHGAAAPAWGSAAASAQHGDISRASPSQGHHHSMTAGELKRGAWPGGGASPDAPRDARRSAALRPPDS
jgi:hypothetical protein